MDNRNNGHTATCGVLRGAAAVVCVVIVVVIRVKGYRLWVMEFAGCSLRSNVCRRDAGAPFAGGTPALH